MERYTECHSLQLYYSLAAVLRGVRTHPGQIALQVTPVPAVSKATTYMQLIGGEIPNMHAVFYE